jgi:hypothetical protein
MIASGIPRVHAAAIECSASLGGQLMPPVMGVAAFLMAEFWARATSMWWPGGTPLRSFTISGSASACT